MELESAAVLRTGCATRQPRRQRGEEDCAARESSIFPDALRDRLRGDLNVGAVQTIQIQISP